MTTVLIILSILTIAAYTAAVCIKQGGIPHSISATFYQLEHKFWFGATMWLTAGFLMPSALELSKTGSEWAAFLACVGMFLVGLSPNFREKHEGTIHDIGAIMCLSFSQLLVLLNCPSFFFLWLLYLFYTVVAILRQKEGDFIYKLLNTKPMFWVEIAALLTTYSTVLYGAIK